MLRDRSVRRAVCLGLALPLFTGSAFGQDDAGGGDVFSSAGNGGSYATSDTDSVDTFATNPDDGPAWEGSDTFAATDWENDPAATA